MHIIKDYEIKKTFCKIFHNSSQDLLLIIYAIQKRFRYFQFYYFMTCSENRRDFFYICFPKNFFFLETKGDILRSHGYLNESVKFYKIVLNKFPDNYYIKYKIFLDTNTKNMQSNDKINFFYENLNLIIKFPKNKYIINKIINEYNKL